MMDEKGLSEENNDSLYSMFFGVSCAFFALKLLPEPEQCDEKLSEIRNRMLKGSAHLLGMFIWRIQREESEIGKSHLLHKLENAEKQIQELKKQRSEDAKANERVVSIVATREQSWFVERKNFRQQIGALMNELRVVEKKYEQNISELNEKLKESEVILQSKDKSIEESEQKRLEIEEQMRKAENLADELRENLRREAQRHSNEISKHKTAFIELVSNQRQFEAEMGRALRQVEAAKQELVSVLEQKEQSVLLNQRLSMEIVKMRKDLEQKDQILSAILRKMKLDTAEKQMLLKEVKSSKAKKKISDEGKNERHSLRNILSRRGSLRATRNEYGHEFEKHEVRKGDEEFSIISDPYLTESTDGTQIITDFEHMENREDSKTGTYKLAIEKRHNLEIEAFGEQLRVKDEKLEAFRWRLLSMELESKRMQNHMEGLDLDITQLKQENMKLETLLRDRDAELHSLKEQLMLQFNPPNLQKLQFNPPGTLWSNVKVVKRKSPQKNQEMKAISKGSISQEMENHEKVDEVSAIQQLKDIVLVGPDHFRRENIESDEVVANAETSTSLGQGSCKRMSSSWKMDIHALGVAYKIKRLKQQFLMLERLTGKQESCENENRHFGIKGFYALVSILNKQVDRYQSLQGKTDDLCQRMHDDNLNLNSGRWAIARTEDETKNLEHFLEETFQLQRYIVATGQKLMEVQAKIASGFVCDAETIEETETFDMKRFSDSIRTLFREVQRGLEVRISKIIGDLEGTMACDGIIHFRK